MSTSFSTTSIRTLILYPSTLHPLPSPSFILPAWPTFSGRDASEDTALSCGQRGVQGICNMAQLHASATRLGAGPFDGVGTCPRHTSPVWPLSPAQARLGEEARPAEHGPLHGLVGQPDGEKAVLPLAGRGVHNGQVQTALDTAHEAKANGPIAGVARVRHEAPDVGTICDPAGGAAGAYNVTTVPSVLEIRSPPAAAGSREPPARRGALENRQDGCGVPRLAAISTDPAILPPAVGADSVPGGEGSKTVLLSAVGRL